MSDLLEEHTEALFEKLLEKALGGDGPSLLFLAKRILPRERTIRVQIPFLQNADDAVAAMTAVMRAVGEGDISPSEGAALTDIVKANREAIDLAEVLKKIEELKQKIE